MLHRHLRGLPLIALAAFAGGPLTGCLEARNGARSGQTDTVSGTDTWVAGDADTVGDPCAAKVCDDGDPCTIDWCDSATGLCSSAMPSGKQALPAEPPECSDDGGCDDGDPCTKDQCRATGDDCAEYFWAYCVNEPIVGCGGCGGSCDDGDPCTADACGANGTCNHTLVPGACGGGCSGLNAIEASSIEWSAWPGDAVTVAGVALAYENAVPVCSDTAYGGEEQDPCYACSYPVGLSGSIYAHATVALSPPAGWEGAPWACLDYCNNTCTPLQWGAAYWVWGTAGSSWMGTGAGAEAPSEDPGQGMARPPTDRLAVAGWCLQTNAAGLRGKYRGTVTVDGYPEAFPFDAEISLLGGELQITIGPGECVTGLCPSWIHEVLGPQTVPLSAGDGAVAFDMEMLGRCDYSPTMKVHVELASNRNSLSGEFFDSWQTFAQEGPPDGDVAWCSHGTMALTRLP